MGLVGIVVSLGYLYYGVTDMIAMKREKSRAKTEGSAESEDKGPVQK